MHIAFVVEHCHKRGGHERCVYEWARRLSRRHRVSILSHSVDDIDRGRIHWIPVRSLRGPAVLMYLNFYIRAGLRTRSLNDAIVHSQGANCPKFDVSSVHTVIAEKLYILKKLGSFFHEMTTLQRVSWSVHYKLARCFESRLFRHPEGILVPVSGGTGDELRRHYNPPEERIRVVPNGVDLDEFHPGDSFGNRSIRDSMGLDPDGSYFLFVGGEWARKGLPTVIEALSHCIKPHVLVAGFGPVEVYRRLAEKFGVTRRIHFIGPVQDTSKLYRTGTALLMPSHYEAFSLVSLEAAASGLPILASPVSGTDELIEQENNGWIIEREPKKWADHMERLSEDAGLAKRMGAASRNIAGSFTWDRAVSCFEEIYRTIR